MAGTANSSVPSSTIELEKNYTPPIRWKVFISDLDQTLWGRRLFGTAFHTVVEWHGLFATTTKDRARTRAAIEVHHVFSEVPRFDILIPPPGSDLD